MKVKDIGYPESKAIPWVGAPRWCFLQFLSQHLSNTPTLPNWFGGASCFSVTLCRSWCAAESTALVLQTLQTKGRSASDRVKRLLCSLAAYGLLQWSNFVSRLDAKCVPMAGFLTCFQVPARWWMLKIGHNNHSSGGEAADVKTTTVERSNCLKAFQTWFTYTSCTSAQGLTAFDLKLKLNYFDLKNAKVHFSIRIFWNFVLLPLCSSGLARVMSKGCIYLHQSNRHTQSGIALDLGQSRQKISHKVLVWCFEENDSPCWRSHQHRKPIAIILGACASPHNASRDEMCASDCTTAMSYHSRQRQAVSFLNASCPMSLGGKCLRPQGQQYYLASMTCGKDHGLAKRCSWLAAVRLGILPACATSTCSKASGKSGRGSC